LFYRHADKRDALARADHLDDLSLSFVGKLSDAAKKIRQAYE